MLLTILSMLRPRQWTKNAFVLAPLFFSFTFGNMAHWQSALVAMGCFIMVSGAVYIFNDLRDIEEDRTHPRKRFRPITSGKISVRAACSIMIGCLMAVIASCAVLPLACSMVIGTYVLLQLIYTSLLKHEALYDVAIIASGFVLRVLMGAYAINVPVSPWIITTTYLLALFLGFGKRYHELHVAGYHTSRRSLGGYNAALLTLLIGISCGATLMSYSLYTIETARAFEAVELVYSIVFVVLGLFRYLQVLFVDKAGGEPERILLGDAAFIANGIMWLVVTLGILAHAKQLW